MKVITTIILMLMLNLGFGQDTLFFGVTTPKGKSGSITDPRTIIYSGKLDFNFYTNHFGVLFYYPSHMVDYNRKNETITIWNDSMNIGDLETNWCYTTGYDSESRISFYRYSGCLSCSRSPFNYQFYYNQTGQIVKITNDINENKTIELEYNASENIMNVKVSRDSKLIQEISLINRN